MLAEKFTDDLSKKHREQIFYYYFQNLYFFREGITISILFTALLIYHLNIQLGFITYLHLAYLLAIVGISYNEILIWRWRGKRKKITLKES